jgi:transposase
MIAITGNVRVWLATGHTDMRRGFPSLARLVQESLNRDPHIGDLYVFRERRGDLIRIIWHDGQGACLFTKRLERGRFLWPSLPDGVVTISVAQLSYLLSGIDWRMPQMRRELNKLPIEGTISYVLGKPQHQPHVLHRRARRTLAEIVEPRDDDTALGGLHSYRTTSGMPQAQVLADILLHLFNHQTHYRGQAHACLSILTGDEPPSLDLLAFQRGSAAPSLESFIWWISTHRLCNPHIWAKCAATWTVRLHTP